MKSVTMKKRWRRIALLVGLVAVVIYLIVTLNFASSKSDEEICQRINVQVLDKDELNFVTPNDVVSIIKATGERVIGVPLGEINTYKIQKVLESKSFIKTVSVYSTIDGALNVKLTQRVPVVRVHTPNGAFYMDDEGFVFPLSNEYTHYVPIVTGDMPLPFKLPYKGNMPEGEKSKILLDLLNFVAFLGENNFWNAQVEQINILRNGDVELIPRAGNHIVRLGTFEGYPYKLQKLYTFYKKALPVEGWKKYSTLDLRFSNQVVATLK